MAYFLNQQTRATQTNFSAQIEEIISKRKELSEEVNTTKENVDQLLNYLKNLDNQKNNICNRIKDESIKARLQKVHFQDRIEKLKKEQIQLKKLLSRFTRDTINIAVVGKAGQGKSTLLQTLTGLDDKIIPSGMINHCTAVRSKISNHLNGEKIIQAELHYHNKISFFDEVISPYYSALELEGDKPKNIENFIENLLPRLLNEKPSHINRYNFLKKYHEKLSSNTEILSNTNHPKKIEESDLREYITQDRSSELEYMIVKEINIKCCFPNSEVMGIHQLAFVDMPGSGDGKSHNSANLLQTLGEEIDFVLFISKPPAAFRDEAELNASLQDLFHDSNGDNAISNLPIKKWSFYVANYHPSSDVKHDNQAACEEFKDIISKKDYVANVVIANCNDEQEATTNILSPVLNYLAENLNDLDQEYASKCRKSLENFYISLNEELSLVSISTQKANWEYFGELNTRYTNCFNDLFKNLKTELINFTKNLSEQKNCKDVKLENFIEKAINNCNAETLLPSLEDINTQINNDGYVSVHTNYLKILKAEILTPFKDVDKCFHESLLDIKLKIITILVEIGKLDKTVSKYRDNPNQEFKVDFLDDLLKSIPEYTKAESLKQAIENLNKFTISYRAEIEGIIKNQDNIKHLIPEDTTHTVTNFYTELEKKLNPKKFNNSIAIYTRDSLIKAYNTVIKNSEFKLRKLSEDPNKKLAEMMRTFIDEAFEAEGVKDDWRKFLSYYITEIWSEEFANDAEDNKLKQEWMENVRQVQTAANSLATLKF